MRKLFGGTYRRGPPLETKRQNGTQIFEVTTTTSDAKLVVKLQNIKYGTMAREIDTYRKLQSERCANIANVICSGEDQGNYAIVMPKYYMNLHQFFFLTPMEGMESIFSLTVFASDMIRALEFIHSKRIIHCDIRPENFMLTSLSSPLELEIVLLDFEAAVAVGETRLDQEQRVGDVYFASPRFLHDLAAPRTDDDLVALAYMMASLARQAPLPWDSFYKDILHGSLSKHAEFETACHRLADAKLSTDFKSYCEDLPPLYYQFLAKTIEQSGGFDYASFQIEFKEFSQCYIKEKFQMK